MTLYEALKVVVKDEHLADYIYHVREHAMGSGDGYTGESWNHPRVKRFSEAVTVLENYVKENERMGGQ